MHLEDGLASSGAPKKRKRPSCFEPPKLEQQPAAKKLKKSNQERRPPASFWDNLSRQFLTRRTLEEFDRRTTHCRAPLPASYIDPVDLPKSRLKRFARRGGPDLEDLRSYPEPKSAPESSPMSSDPSSSRKSKSQRTGPSSNTSFTQGSGRRTSAYDPAFKQHLEDHGIYPCEYYDGSEGQSSVYPNNVDDLNSRLAVTRPSLSPSRFDRDDFRQFRKANDDAKNEADVMADVFPTIIGKRDIPCQRGDTFEQLVPLTNGSIVDASPDFYDGDRPGAANRQLREVLGDYIVPTSTTTRPILPNFFAELKGPKGNPTVAKVQACYDGAIGARGMHQVRSHANSDSAFDNNAYTITSTYTGGTAGGFLTLYATHPTSSDDPRHSVEYRMTQLRSFSMTDSIDSFRKGATAIRNARDWAKEQREQAIRDANARAELLASDTATSQASQSSTIMQGASDTSADELAGDDPMVTSFVSSTSFSASASQGLQASGKQRRPRKNSQRTLKRRRGAYSN